MDGWLCTGKDAGTPARILERCRKAAVSATDLQSCTQVPYQSNTSMSMHVSMYNT